MRPLEILLVLLISLEALAALTKSSGKRLFLWLSGLALFTLVAHAILEGPHWQMAAGYLAALLSLSLLGMQRLMAKRIAGCVMLVLVVATCTASAMIPMFRLPAPTGPDAIGTRILHVVNDHPGDPSSANARGQRELMIQVWYPASPSHAPLAPYRKLVETTLKSSYQAVLWTHSRWNAPFIPGGPLPILLLNPAWSGRRTYYTYLVEDLASHGYIVVGIDHTGNSGPTAFPDGHVEQPNIDPKLGFSDHTFAQLSAYGGQQVEIQAEDNRFVLDQFQSWNNDPASPFYGRVDMNRVGALGHSFGGAAAAEACLEDSRIKSALDMDGSFWGPVLKVGLAKPIMMIEGDIAQWTPEQLRQDNAALVDHLLDLGDREMMQKSNGYLITLHGSSHSSFTDRSLFSPLKSSSEVGSIPALREYAIVRTYVLAFFDKTLRGTDPEILRTTKQPYPEITMEIMHRP